METNLTTRTFYEDLFKSAYAEIDEFPLMASASTVPIIVLVYLAFVLKIGPMYMKNRDPFQLKNTILIYNFLQVVLSAYLVHRFFRYEILEWGLVARKCYMNEDKSRTEVFNSLWVYLFAKISELLDTVFFVLRKKGNQLSFLHVYHHAIMVVATWATFKYWPTHINAYPGFINSLVHVFMYAYYGLSGLGPNVAKYLWWKRYLTSFQMIQFVTMIIYYGLAVSVSDCPPAKGYTVFFTSNTLLLLFLFSNFYKQSYQKIKKAV